jgi:hypothetical protein
MVFCLFVGGASQTQKMTNIKPMPITESPANAFEKDGTIKSAEKKENPTRNAEKKKKSTTTPTPIHGKKKVPEKALQTEIQPKKTATPGKKIASAKPVFQETTNPTAEVPESTEQKSEKPPTPKTNNANMLAFQCNLVLISFLGNLFY